MNVCRAVHVFGLARFSPTVLAVPPLYEPENVSVLSVAVRSARLDPSEMPEIVEFVRAEFGTLDTVSTPPLFVSPVPSSDVNDEPFSMKLVVDAVTNDEYAVDEEYPNVILPVESIVVVAVPPKYAVYADS